MYIFFIFDNVIYFLYISKEEKKLIKWYQKNILKEEKWFIKLPKLFGKKITKYKIDFELKRTKEPMN